MKTNTIRSSRLALTLSPLTLLAAGSTFGACTAEFEVACPEGQQQVAGGGDVNQACQPKGQQGEGGAAGSGGPQGGSAGAPGAGSGGTAGSGGGGGLLPVPPGGVCQPNDTKCEGDAQQTCNAEGQWGEPQTCEIGCGPAIKACVVPVQLAAGGTHVCARMNDGTVRCWGGGASGQLGNGRGADGKGQDQLAPKLIANLAGVAEIAASNQGTCAKLTDGTFTCWGDNTSKQLQSFTGDVFTPAPVALPEGKALSTIALGSFHTCALSDKNELYCRGSNNLGQVGNGVGGDGAADVSNFTRVNSPDASTFRQLVANTFMTWAVTESGNLFCWGANFDATCNLGGIDTNGDAIFSTVTQPRLVSFGSEGGVGQVRSIATNGDTVCAIQVDGKLLCWGENHSGQLGLGGGTSDDGKDYNPPNEPQLGGKLVDNVSVGGSHVCAITNERKAFCWGLNREGQLGTACGPDLECDTNDFSSLYSGIPHQVPIQSDVTEVHAGGNEFTCALTIDAKVYCWGENRFGVLGVNQTQAQLPDRATPAPVLWR